jgi:hypothetical protein
MPHNHSGERACVRFPDTLGGGLSSRVGAGAHNHPRAAVLRHRQRVLAHRTSATTGRALNTAGGLLRHAQKTPPQLGAGRGGWEGVGLGGYKPLLRRVCDEPLDAAVLQPVRGSHGAVAQGDECTALGKALKELRDGNRAAVGAGVADYRVFVVGVAGDGDVGHVRVFRSCSDDVDTKCILCDCQPSINGRI